MSQIVLLSLISTMPMAALDPRLATKDYVHVSWTQQEEGTALPGITTFAQTADGYMWLGSITGLIRFDGMRFVKWDPPNGEKLPEPGILHLLASSDGSLLIRTANSISRLDHGRLKRYPEIDQWLSGKRHAMSKGNAGRFWLRRRGEPLEVGLLNSNGTFRVYRKSDGLPDGIQTIFEDRNSIVWITTAKELCRWQAGEPAKCIAYPRVDLLRLAGDTVATLLESASSETEAFPQLEGSMTGLVGQLVEAHYTPTRLLRDHDGNVWIGTSGQGLLRLAGGKLERFAQAEGLSHDDIRELLEDREHNIWLATARGLDRFRDPQVLRFSTANGLSSNVVTAVQGAADGSMWVGTSLGLNRIVAGEAAVHPAGFPNSAVRSLMEDKAGKLWSGTATGFGVFAGGRFSEVATRQGSHLTKVFAIAQDPDGVVWLADEQQGLFTIGGGTAIPVSLPDVETNDIYRIQFDRTGNLWIGFLHRGVAAVKGTMIRKFSAREGLAGDSAQAILEDRAGSIWVGTPEGLSRFRNGVWTRWTAREGLPEGGVSAILEDDRDTIWLMTPQGLSRLAAATLSESRDGAPRNIKPMAYGQVEQPAATSIMANPRWTRSRDGRLWFCTDNGIAIVDPAGIRKNLLPPPVAVEEVVVDGRAMDLTTGSNPGFRGRRVHIKYTGLSLTAPQRVRFKYKLEDVDREWTDVDYIRSVDYVNLPPGSYRFRVQASNNDGVWNTAGATLAFQIQPYFYQTTWFALLCVLTAVLIAWGIHRMRMQMVIARYEGISNERARLTRELHDSLLQGFVAVVYQLEAVAKQMLNAPEVGKKRLEQAIDQADGALGDARRTMAAMRLPALESNTLPEAVSKVAAELKEGTDISFDLEVKGKVRHLAYEAQANLFFICREAISNSVNHARATRIQVSLTYTPKEVRLIVEDDGKGFVVEAAMAKNGHWGMAGMHERANQMGATFSVRSSPGQGAKVELVVPAKG